MIQSKKKKETRYLHNQSDLCNYVNCNPRKIDHLIISAAFFKMIYLKKFQVSLHIAFVDSSSGGIEHFR